MLSGTEAMLFGLACGALLGGIASAWMAAAVEALAGTIDALPPFDAEAAFACTFAGGDSARRTAGMSLVPHAARACHAASDH